MRCYAVSSRMNHVYGGKLVSVPYSNSAIFPRTTRFMTLMPRA
jgi:hypothetical protein